MWHSNLAESSELFDNFEELQRKLIVLLRRAFVTLRRE